MRKQIVPLRVGLALHQMMQRPPHKEGRVWWADRARPGSYSDTRHEGDEFQVFTTWEVGVELEPQGEHATRRWNILDRCVYGPDGTLASRELVPQSSFVALTGHDICCYCGWDNGPNGEWRQGYDCGYCGGN